MAINPRYKKAVEFLLAVRARSPYRIERRQMAFAIWALKNPAKYAGPHQLGYVDERHEAFHAAAQRIRGWLDGYPEMLPAYRFLMARSTEKLPFYMNTVNSY